jgi:5'(3')-deoxyribonucleotidase
LIDRILLDLDGVLVMLLDGLQRFHNKTCPGYPHNPDTQTEQMPWDIPPIFGMTEAEIWEPLGYEFWRDLKPTPWCYKIVELLTNKFGEKNICLLSSPIRTDGCIDGKIEWIRRNLPQFRRQFLIGPRKEFAAGPSHCLVDDHIVNIKAFQKAGGQTFLFPASWNHRFREHPVVAMQWWIDALSEIENC